MNELRRYANVEAILEGRIRGNQLMVSGLGLTAEEARLLWESPRMEGISWLDLDDNQLGNEGLKDLAACAKLVNVQYLNLTSNNISDAGLEILAKSKNLPKLKRLHLRKNPIQGKGVLSLFNSETLESLSVFQIHDGWTCKKREGWRYNPQG